MTDYWMVNGHREDCAYIRSLDDLDGYEECDCAADDEYEDFDDGSLAYKGY